MTACVSLSAVKARAQATKWEILDQLVIGAAAPVTRAGGVTEVAFLTYFSYELPFRR